MSSPQGSPRQRPAVAQPDEAVHPGYWLVPVLRAVPAIIVGLVITFSEDHSPGVGLVAFGAFAVVTGAVILAGSLRLLGKGVVRGALATQGAIAAACGIAALALMASGVGVLLLIVTVFTALTGALEIYAALRSRGWATSRDWLTVGVYTAVAAIVFVLIPPDPILATGLIGAYGIILGVFLLIAGLSLRWAAEKPEHSTPAERESPA